MTTLLISNLLVMPFNVNPKFLSLFIYIDLYIFNISLSQKKVLILNVKISSIITYLFQTLNCMKLNVRFGLIISAKNTPVAFTAGMRFYSDSWRGDILVFPHVITNKGYGYSPSSGKFTAPRDGTYVFTVTVVSYGSNYLNLDIVHDGDSKVRTLSHGSAAYQTGTNLVVLELDRGDAVWVKRVYGQSYYTHPVPLITFSGFILWGGSLNVELLCDLCNYEICFIL